MYPVLDLPRALHGKHGSAAGPVPESIVPGAAGKCNPPHPSTASAGGVHESQQAPLGLTVPFWMRQQQKVTCLTNKHEHKPTTAFYLGLDSKTPSLDNFTALLPDIIRRSACSAIYLTLENDRFPS